MQEILVRDEGMSGTVRTFVVTVGDDARATTHRVTVTGAYAEKIAGGRASDDVLVRRSFEFLLAREPRESILREFSLTDVPKYFPEYERALKRALGR